MKKTYYLHTDPGHAWLQVEREELQRLGIDLKISWYSYQNGNLVYLEEDCDMGIFIAAKTRHGEEVRINETRHNCRKNYSKVRGYACYQKPDRHTDFEVMDFVACDMHDFTHLGGYVADVERSPLSGKQRLRIVDRPSEVRDHEAGTWVDAADCELINVPLDWAK